KERHEIDFAGNGGAGRDFQGRLGRLFERSKNAAFGSGNFKAIPMLVVSVAQQNVAPGHVGNLDRRDDGLEGDVLEPLELQIHLDLPLRWESDQKERNEDEGAGHARLKYCNSPA